MRQWLKKSDDGMVLPYVMVVILVMCIISCSLMSTSLKNLQSQQASVERMQDRYVAEGQIQRFKTEVEDEINSSTSSSEIYITVSQTMKNTAKEVSERYAGTIVVLYEENGLIWDTPRNLISNTTSNEAKTIETTVSTYDSQSTFPIQVEFGSVIINATFDLRITTEKTHKTEKILESTEAANQEPSYKIIEETSYKITSVAITYNSYEVITVAPDERGDTA